MKGNELLLSMLGFSRVERMTVASVCSLTQRRPRGYAVLPNDSTQTADIVLVDADDPSALNAWYASDACTQGRPSLMIARNSSQLTDARYTMQRANFSARLVRMLDTIVMHEYRYMPDTMVGEETGSQVALSGIRNMAPPRPTQTKGGRPRVLVVDDALVVRTQMHALLEMHKVQTVLAADAEQAISMMQVAEPFAMVFLDVVLPGMDGYAACRKLKSIDREVPIIMLTGRDSPFDKIRGVMAGCNRYLTKPVSVEDLTRVLYEFLEMDLPAHALRI